MNRRKEWEEAQKTPESMKVFLTDLAEKEQEWVKTGYSDGNYTRKLIEEALAETEDPEKRAVLLECSQLCPPVDPFEDLSLDTEEEEKTYLIYWEPGEIVKFGRFTQWSNEEVKPIEWIVLETSIDGYMHMGSDTRLLLSRYALDDNWYGEEKEDITWETCCMRAYLNGEFLEESFSEKEQEKLVLTKLHNPGISIARYDVEFTRDIDEWIDGGPDTEDKVFFLSSEDFDNLPEELRTCSIAGHNTKCDWWLRAPSFDDVSFMKENGGVDDPEEDGWAEEDDISDIVVSGQYIDTEGKMSYRYIDPDEYLGVRPAIVVRPILKQ